MTPRQQIALALSIPFTATLVVGLAFASLQPVPEIPLPTVATHFDAARAQQLAQELSEENPERVVGSSESAAAREWFAEQFAELGLSVETLPFTVTVASQARAGMQVWATVPGASDAIIIVTAHYDTPKSGGRDNAAGLASVLELARVFAEEQPRHTLIFLLSDSHEYGLSWGARNFVEQRLTPQQVRAVLALTASDDPRTELDSAGFQFGYAPLWLRQVGLEAAQAADGDVQEAVGVEELLARAFPFGMTEHGMFLRGGLPAIGLHAPSAETLGRAAEIALRAVDALESVPPGAAGDWRLSASEYLPAWATLFLPLLLFAPLFLATVLAWLSDRSRWQDLRLEWSVILGLLVAGLDGYAAAFSLQALGLLPRYEWFPATPGDPFLLQIQDWAWIVIYGVAAVFAWYTFGRPRSWGHLADVFNIPVAHRRNALLILLCLLVLAVWLLNSLAAMVLLLPAAYLWPWIAPRPTRRGRLLNTLLALGGLAPLLGVFIGVALTPGLGLWWWFLTLAAAYGLIPLPVVLAGLLGLALWMRFIRLGWR
jgi:hypothetical protein